MTNEEASKLAKIETKVDALHYYLLGNGHEGILEKHNDRIHSLESDRDKAKGIVAILSAMGLGGVWHVIRKGF